MMQKNTYYQPTITAVLGPTNTGKTHFAIERMLKYSSGIAGFPLRLLARENYDRAIKVKGYSQVALITGEEKIIPPEAQWFFCTVESMPIDKKVDFIAVDEIQMCADRERGHIFTERLIYSRGVKETMFMGSDVIKPVLKILIPEAKIVYRPRLSTLSYAGPKKFIQLPKRSALVSFSVSNVYALAERVRRQRGGAAIVMGALSPRTRNAQVNMYQAGEVDYLVATDAIGMGLNMDINHVAFSETYKFDGQRYRGLSAAELAQTAGRAGRYMNDGSFGTTGLKPQLDERTINAIEEHQFNPLQFIYWRNPYLEFLTLNHLFRSLASTPPSNGLVRAHKAEDELSLIELSKETQIQKIAQTPDTVALLWEVCQIPDFRKLTIDAHAVQLRNIYRYLTGPEGKIPTDWINNQVKRLDRADGEIETLMQRIAGIRTWTYVSHHSQWLSDAIEWQARTNQIEERLSDALHERLTQRFVDRRQAFLMSRINDNSALKTTIENDGEVSIEGEIVGKINGFTFIPEEMSSRNGVNWTIANVAKKILINELSTRIKQFENDSDSVFTIGGFSEGSSGRLILWRGSVVARLEKGSHILVPEVRVVFAELIGHSHRNKIKNRIKLWLEGFLRKQLSPLFSLTDMKLRGPARGLRFQLLESLGAVARAQVVDQLKYLTKKERKNFNLIQLQIGRHSVYFPKLLNLSAVNLRKKLWSIYYNDVIDEPSLSANQVSIKMNFQKREGFYISIGYLPMGPLAIRIDIAEQLAAQAWKASRKKVFMIQEPLLSLVNATFGEMIGVMESMGYKYVRGVDSLSPRKNLPFFKRPYFSNKKKKTDKENQKNEQKYGDTKNKKTHVNNFRKYNPDSPFFKLQVLYNLDQTE